MNAGPLAATLATALCFLGSGPSDAAEPPRTGIIKGRFVWAGEAVPKQRDLFAPTPKPILSEDLVVDPKSRGVANVFVFLTGLKPTPLPEAGHDRRRVVLNQQDYRFVPHALAAHSSQTLAIRSSDPIGHNARLSTDACHFNQMVAAGGEIEERLRGPDPRIRPIGCDIHGWMKAVIMVFDHPYYDVSRTDGRFEIRDIPAGPQRLVLLHEALGYLDPAGAKGRPIEVKAGETLDLGDIPVKPRPELQLKAAP